jgi:hypothetical protein
LDYILSIFCQYFSSPSPKWGFQSPKFSDLDFREVRGLGLGRPKSSGNNPGQQPPNALGNNPGQQPRAVIGNNPGQQQRAALGNNQRHQQQAALGNNPGQQQRAVLGNNPRPQNQLEEEEDRFRARQARARANNDWNRLRPNLTQIPPPDLNLFGLGFPDQGPPNEGNPERNRDPRLRTAPHVNENETQQMMDRQMEERRIGYFPDVEYGSHSNS